VESADAAMAGYPKVVNIEMDPHEGLNAAGLFDWVTDPALEGVLAYEPSLKEHPNPPPPTSRALDEAGEREARFGLLQETFPWKRTVEISRPSHLGLRRASMQQDPAPLWVISVASTTPVKNAAMPTIANPSG
jgi:hypothetical protein